MELFSLNCSNNPEKKASVVIGMMSFVYMITKPYNMEARMGMTTGMVLKKSSTQTL